MQKLRLENGIEYELAVNGFLINGDELNLAIITDEPVEAINTMFLNPLVTKVMKVKSGELTQEIVENYIERGNVITRKENQIIEKTIVSGTPDVIKERKGTIIEFKMYKRTIETDVEKNRADIDYLMMMGGEPV